MRLVMIQSQRLFVTYQYLLPVLKNICDDKEEGPVLLHVVTHKGHGYPPAEESDDKYHGVAKFDIVTGKQHKPKPNAPSYTSVFAKGLVAEAREDNRIVAITTSVRRSVRCRRPPADRRLS